MQIRTNLSIGSLKEGARGLISSNFQLKMLILILILYFSLRCYISILPPVCPASTHLMAALSSMSKSCPPHGSTNSSVVLGHGQGTQQQGEIVLLVSEKDKNVANCEIYFV